MRLLHNSDKKSELTFLSGIGLGFLSLLVMGLGLGDANFPDSHSSWNPGVMFYIAPFLCMLLLGSAFYLIKRANDIRSISDQEADTPHKKERRKVTGK